MNQRPARLLAALVLAALPDAHLAAQSSSPLSMTATNVTAIERTRDATAGSSPVRSGDVVRYDLTFTNEIDEPIHGLRLLNPLPEGLRYRWGSATIDAADARLEVSVDGGLTFVPASALPTAQRGAVTQLRWIVIRALAPRHQVRASCEATFIPLAHASRAEEPLTLPLAVYSLGPPGG